MSYTLVINNQNLVGTGNNTYQYNFLQGNFTIPEGTQMMVANVQIPYSFYNMKRSVIKMAGGDIYRQCSVKIMFSDFTPYFIFW